MPNRFSAAFSSHISRLAQWLCVVILLVIAVAPALTRSHIEGFSYFTQTLSLLLPDVSLADPLWALNSDFYYLTRPGVIWAMAPLSILSPASGYDLLMWLAMPVFLGGIVVVARLVSGASWLACVAALLCLPIALEANFFFNDNVVAGALTLWAVVFLLARGGLASAVFAGAIFSLAVLCRLDQILNAPFLGIIAILHVSSLRSVLARWTAFAVGFGVVHGLFAILDPQAANLFHRITVAANADSAWSRTADTLGPLIFSDLLAAMVAIGAGIPAIMAGACELHDRTRIAAQNISGLSNRFRLWAMPLMLIGYPFAIYALTVGKYYDPRGLITMLPMLAPLAAIGLDQWVFEPLRRMPIGMTTVRQRVDTSFKVAILLMPVLVPGVPTISAMLSIGEEAENAVPSYTGRIWYGNAWRDWQERNFHRPDRSVERLVDMLTEDKTSAAVVTTFWTEDRRFQNILAVRGFKPMAENGECARVAELWAHPDGATVHLVRMHVPYLPNIGLNSASLFVAYGLDCLLRFPSDRRFALSPTGVFVTYDATSHVLLQDADGHFRMTDTDLQLFAAKAIETVRSYGTATYPVTATAASVVEQARGRLN